MRANARLLRRLAIARVCLTGAGDLQPPNDQTHCKAIRMRINPAPSLSGSNALPITAPRLSMNRWPSSRDPGLERLSVDRGRVRSPADAT
jgi:hypothetical protein